MNKKKLKEAEKNFLVKYPKGFQDPAFADLEKKHKMNKMVEQTQTFFAKRCFKDTDGIMENFSRIVSRSSMVSMFEKPKFRDFSRGLAQKERIKLSAGLEKMLHGAQRQGFEMMLEVLSAGKLAKWSLITIVPACYKPDTEVFVKPTTARGVISVFELDQLEYQSRPSWEFYREYRTQINEMKKLVNKNLSPSNAAFSGFLMMSMQDR